MKKNRIKKKIKLQKYTSLKNKKLNNKSINLIDIEYSKKNMLITCG